MERVLNDDSATCEVQVREVYNMGRYLAGGKYRWDSYAYLAFITGILAAALAFVGSALL